MIRSLRKRHLNAWIILALVLPLGFIWAYLVIPHNLPDPLEAVVSTGELFSIKKATNGTDQLEITIQQPLTTPSTLVYLAGKSTPDIKTALLIGSLGPRGKYVFNLPSQLPQDPVVLFYDAISKNIYHQVAIP